MEGSRSLAHTNVSVEYVRTACAWGHEKYLKMLTHSSSYAVDFVEYWCSKPKCELEENCDVIKIFIFWPILFEKCTSDFVPCQRFMDDSCLNLKRLNHIEILEDVLDLAKRVCDNPFFIRGILSIGHKINDRVFDIAHALEWVRCTGDDETMQKLHILGDQCWPPLEIFFSEFQYYIEKVANELCKLVDDFEYLKCDTCIKKSELLKTRGNKEFSREKFDLAIKWYTRAIELAPENHLIYGNRALCYLRLSEHTLALADGKRAIILQQKWSKGHHRFCDALFSIGEHERALAANLKAQKLCEKDPDGIKDLIQQNIKFKREVEEIKGGKPGVLEMRFWGKGSGSDYGCSEEPELSTSLYRRRSEEKTKMTPVSTGITNKMDSKDSAKKSDLENKRIPSDLSAGLKHKSHNGESRSKSPRRKSRSRSKESVKPREPDVLKVALQDNQKTKSSTASEKVHSEVLSEMLKTLVHNGYTALLEQCCHSALQSFSQLLDILDPADLKKLHLATIDYVVLIYGYANALLGIGQPEELTEAELQFNKIIEKYTKLRFNCLAFYGIGNVYLRQNRFLEARDQFMKSQIMLNRKIVPGVLKWPTTSVVIEETRSEKLQLLLENCIEECKFPPEPDAVCRSPQCQGHIKKQIYFTDPDFKGFVRMLCCQLCKVEFHNGCWKKLKASAYSDKNDKDFLEDTCFTPDCKGNIFNIVIFNSTGLVKWEYEHKIMKVKGSRKPIVNQKCTSPRKLHLKEERKLRRKMLGKQKRNSSEDRKEETPKENNFSKEDFLKANAQIKICFADTMLHQFMENSELIKFGVHNTSKLLSNLLLWCVISKEDHTAYSASTASSSQDEVMERLVNHVIQKNDKVKTRIFLYVLSELHEVDGKLHKWLEEINNLGLRAAEAFLSCYGDCFQKLDLVSLISVWNETYGNKLNSPITSSKAELVTEFFCQASPEEARCLIWLLEENKEKFPCPVLHQALNRFFTIMDVPCTVLKKQENPDVSTNGNKVKNKNRKKKQKEAKSLFVLSGGGTVAQDDHIFTEENTLMFLDSNEPFVVPENVRDLVEEFESFYGDIPCSNAYLKLMDTKTDLTRERLYEYFFQILDEHGPLEMDDDLLVGEFELFPPEAHKIVEEAGGLKPFLLGSLRFFMIDNLIGLLKHELLLKDISTVLPKSLGYNGNNINTQDFPQPLNSARKKSMRASWTLNPGAQEFKPVSDFSYKPIFPQFSTNISVTNPHTTENTNTVKTSPLDNSTVEPQHTPSNLNVGEHSFASCIPLPSVPDNFYMPAISFMAPTPGIVVQPTSITHSDAGIPNHNIEATFERYCAPGNILSNPMKIHQDADARPKSHYSSYRENLFLDKSSCMLSDFGNNSIRTENKRKPSKKPSLTRMVAVQVVIDLSHQDVNTDPFHPFETRQGDILRMEKEHQVLQEQLKEATEKYELTRSRISDEITIVEEQLKKHTEENKISKAELDWFYQDLENEVKKWQQEKKEYQERLRAIKNNVKMHTENNEMCLRSIEEKEQHYKMLLNEFLESSNKFENEKMKFEENIKKGKANVLESAKRAVVSEVSILENRKNIEIVKLCCAMSNGETNLGFLHSLGSSVPASAIPHFKSQIISWNSYISSIEGEIEKIKSQFEERINLVRNGAKLNSFQQVQVATLQPPPIVPMMQYQTPIDDPAILVYSSAPSPIHNPLLPAFSSSNIQGSTQPSLNIQTGNTADVTMSSNHLSYASVEMSFTSVGRSPSKQPSLNKSLVLGGTNPDIDGRKSMADNQPLTSQSVNTSPTKKQEPKKPYDQIIGHLNTIFPHYDSAQLSNFVKEVRVKYGSSFSGLDSNEIVSRVTEFILDHQSKTNVKPAQQEPGHSVSSASMGRAGSEKKEGYNWTTISASKTNSPSKNIASKVATAPPSTQPWKSVGEPAKSNWLNSRDSASFDDDPCIICHEELRQNIIYVLECGHRFHKHCIRTWLNTQSTCPTCRVHVLLKEDFPLLTSRKRRPT